MDLLTSYLGLTPVENCKKALLTEKIHLFNSLEATSDQILKIQRVLNYEFKSQNLVFLNEQEQNPEIQQIHSSNSLSYKNNLNNMLAATKLNSMASIGSFMDLNEVGKMEFQGGKVTQFQQVDVEKELNFSLILKTQIPPYEILVNFLLNLKTSTLMFCTKILNNNKILKAERPFNKIISRFFMNYNAKCHQGSFYINHLDQTLQYTISNQTSSYFLCNLLRNPKTFQSIVSTELKTINEIWSYCLIPLLYLLNREGPNWKNISINNYIDKGLAINLIKKKITQNREKIRKLSQIVMRSHFDLIQLIQDKSILRFSTLSRNEQVQRLSELNQIEKNIKIKQIRRKIQIEEFQKMNKCTIIMNEQHSFKEKCKNIQLISPIIQIFIGKNKFQSTLFKKFDFNQQQKNQFMQNLHCNQYEGKFPIYSEIQIFKTLSQLCIFQSGFSKVYLIEVQCQRETDSQPFVTKLIKKITHTKRYQNQVEILKILKKQKCLFIPRYHYCQQQEMSHAIIMEYINDSTVERYMHLRRKYISMMTKAFVLYEIVVALRFLRDNSIVHVDLKPQNVLIKIVTDSIMQQQHFLVKLIDFGESYSRKIKVTSGILLIFISQIYQGNRGFTVPYAPPELIFQQKKTFDQKTDVFSFGVMMYEILFDHFPLQILKCGKEIYFEENYLKFFSMPFEKLDHFGVRDLSLLMYYICLRCLKKNIRQRPTLDWLSLMLKDIVLIYENMVTYN